MFNLRIHMGRYGKHEGWEMEWWVVAHTHPNKRGQSCMYPSRLYTWTNYINRRTGEKVRVEGEGWVSPDKPKWATDFPKPYTEKEYQRDARKLALSLKGKGHTVPEIVGALKMLRRESGLPPT